MGLPGDHIFSSHFPFAYGVSFSFTELKPTGVKFPLCTLRR